LTENTGGQLVYQFRRAWRDGLTALRLDLLELLERLTVLVAPPRRPLVAYHGLLAPRARWRAALVPTPLPDEVHNLAEGHSTTPNSNRVAAVCKHCI
jgi:hypothetical protein